MRRFCTLNVVLCVLITAPQATPPSAVDGPLRLTFLAKPVKPRFMQGERVNFEFILRNDGKQDVLASPALIVGYDVWLQVSDSLGKEIPWCGVISQWEPLGKKLILLHSGKSLRTTRQISCDEHKEAGLTLTMPGRYTVVAKYEVPFSLKRPKGNVDSVREAKGAYIAPSAEFWVIAEGPAAQP